MLGKFVRFIRSGDNPSAQTSPLLYQVIDLVGKDIGEARDFASTLSPAIESALAYFDRQIASIPGPLPLSQQYFGVETGVGTLFPEAADIGRAMGRSLAVKEKLSELENEGHEEIHALLGMRVKPGQAPTEGQAMVFADHVLHSLAPSPADTREMLRHAAFERLLKNFAEHVEKLRRKQRMHKLDWEWNVQHDVSRTMDTDQNPEFVYADKELTPDNILRGLLAWLKTPEAFFQLKDSSVSLPRPDGAPSAGQATLQQLHCSDRRQWLVCLVRFSVAECRHALLRETHTHRYIFI